MDKSEESEITFCFLYKQEVSILIQTIVQDTY